MPKSGLNHRRKCEHLLFLSVVSVILVLAGCGSGNQDSSDGYGVFSIDDRSWGFEVENCRISEVDEMYVLGRTRAEAGSEFVEMRLERKWSDGGSVWEQFWFHSGISNGGFDSTANPDFSYGLANEGVPGRAELELNEDARLISAVGRFGVTRSDGASVDVVNWPVGTLAIGCYSSSGGLAADDDEYEECVDDCLSVNQSCVNLCQDLYDDPAERARCYSDCNDDLADCMRSCDRYRDD